MQMIHSSQASLASFEFTWIVDRRQKMGWTQIQLSTRAGVSLPTLQNVEAGKGNPSWDVLLKITNALGFSIQFALQAPNWDILAEIGVPLLTEKTRKDSDLGLASLEFSKALAEFVLEKNSFTERQNEAFCAFLWAFRDHYPSLFRKHKKVISSKWLDQKIKSFPLGRLIKLRRLALAQMNMRALA